MGHFLDTTSFEMAEELLISNPRSASQPSPFHADYTTNNQILQSFPHADEYLAIENFGNTMSPMVRELHAMPSPGLQQLPFGPPALPTADTAVLPDWWSAQNWLDQTSAIFPIQSHLPLGYQPQCPPEPVQPTGQKRAPKAPTMSAEKWKPAEGRIRQLYTNEEKTIKDLAEIINKEFGFTAT
jgi:hypothetical protein